MNNPYPSAIEFKDKGTYSTHNLSHPKVQTVQCPTNARLHKRPIVDTTSSQINDTFLFHRVIKILTDSRILQISIAWCQIDGEVRWCQFRYVPPTLWVKSFQISYGHVASKLSERRPLTFFTVRTRKMGKNGTFSHFCKLLQCKNFQEVSEGAIWKLTSWQFRKCGSF